MDTGNSKKWMVWTGRILSALVILMMLFSAAIKAIHSPETVDMFVRHYGYPEGNLLLLTVLELLCVALYVIPRTAYLGAILTTGYLGGAIATHMRVGELAFLNPLVLGIFVWAGLYLRDGKLRQLLPWRR